MRRYLKELSEGTTGPLLTLRDKARGANRINTLVVLAVNDG